MNAEKRLVIAVYRTGSIPFALRRSKGVVIGNYY